MQKMLKNKKNCIYIHKYYRMGQYRIGNYDFRSNLKNKL